MERIQSALDRAREKRKSLDKTSSRHASSPSPSKRVQQDAPLDLPDAWTLVPEFKPDPDVLAAHRIPAVGRTVLSKPLDMLRTKILHMMNDGNWQRLAITSPSAGCGKTTLSLSLAFSISRQSEQRVAVVEGDMRRPSIQTTLGMSEKKYQFSEVLEGRSPMMEHMFRIGHNMVIGANRRPAKNPSEILQSSTMRATLEELQETFDPTIIIFDMPPMLVTDDVMAFAPDVDAAVLVAAAESTSIKEVDICESELVQRTNVLGVVLNKCRYMGKTYGYDYYGE